MRTNHQGFTLLEILLVVAAIGILAGIVIVAINPARQLAETRDAQRHSDVEAISSAIIQYTVQAGSYPSGIPVGTPSAECPLYSDDDTYSICRGEDACGGMVFVGILSPTYIPAIPLDPGNPEQEYSGYAAYINDDNRLVVCSQLAEESSISVTR